MRGVERDYIVSRYQMYMQSVYFRSFSWDGSRVRKILIKTRGSLLALRIESH